MVCVDWDRLDELKTDIGEEDFADVVMLFVSELQDTLSTLTPDRAAANDFHFLRGSAANLGLNSLVAACDAAEAACAAGQPPNVEAVQAAFKTALEDMASRLPHLSLAA